MSLGDWGFSKVDSREAVWILEFLGPESTFCDFMSLFVDCHALLPQSSQ
ncbi:hypothetical protein [Helicobacter zhangjianzhongii]|uniref:Uncharacterized protein n=1 Tax=Helicobacter zhangjianzhongii TaxID=2974574 RepID=A0ACC6FT30_9HELI|nr:MULTISPECIES: hypothetical protein [unclassified Helicobacter]MDL0080305.1 hypothetical protein [Helicobacter sp. CPD2-1]MDL0082364.1 hypothetical protein [Helicobacter sp. XJK30-2]